MKPLNFLEKIEEKNIIQQTATLTKTNHHPNSHSNHLNPSNHQHLNNHNSNNHHQQQHISYNNHHNNSNNKNHNNSNRHITTNTTTTTTTTSTMKEETPRNRVRVSSGGSSGSGSSPSSPGGMLTGLRSFCRPADLEYVELGDLIEIDRTIYTHWGLYVGDGEIVHVSGPKSEISSSESFVRRSFLHEVAGDCLVRINNKEVPAKERGLEPLPLEEILSKSLVSVGQSVPYNFLTRNVEHYVTEWRYGKGWSDQANIALQTMSMFGNSLKDPHAAHHVLVMQINSILNAGHILSSRTDNSHSTHH